MEGLQAVGIVAAILVPIAAFAVWFLDRSHKRRSVDERPYPCTAVIDVQEQVEKLEKVALDYEKRIAPIDKKLEEHDKYLSKDRNRIEQAERAIDVLKTQVSSIAIDVKETRDTTQKILVMMIEEKK